MLSALNTCLARAHSNVWQPLDNFLSIFRSQLSTDLCVCVCIRMFVCRCICRCGHRLECVQNTFFKSKTCSDAQYLTCMHSKLTSISAHTHTHTHEKLSTGITLIALFCYRISTTANLTCNCGLRAAHTLPNTHTLTQSHTQAQSPKGLSRSSGNERII